MLSHDTTDIPVLTKGLTDGTLSRSAGRVLALVKRPGLQRGGEPGEAPAKIRVRKILKPIPPRRLVPRTRGPDVIALQARLNKRGDLTPPLLLDGRFGPKTRRRVVEFQRESWLVPSGMLFDFDWVRLLRRNPRVHVERVTPLAKHSLGVAEASVEARLVYVFSRALAGSAGAQDREKLVGDDNVVAHLAEAITAFAVRPATLERAAPPRDFGWLQRHEFNAIVHDFAEILLFARTIADMTHAVLVLNDILAAAGAEWFFQFIPRKKRKYVTGEPAPTRKAAPAPAARPARPKPAPEPDDDIDEDAQAETLEAAARDGTPFCEECEKARQARENKAA